MQQDIDYLFGEITVQEDEPSTLSELVLLYGEDAVLGEAISNWRYRNKYPRVYRKASDAIKAEFPRAQVGTKQKKDKTETPVLEGETSHLSRFFTGKDDKGNAVLGADGAPLTEEQIKANQEKLRGIITKIAQEEPLYVKGERSGAGGKINQKSQELANAHFAKGDEHVEKVIAAIEGKMPGYTVGRNSDGEATPESLARGLMALQKFLTKEAENAVLAMG